MRGTTRALLGVGSFGILVACAGAGGQGGAQAPRPPAGVEERDIIRCGGDESDTSYFRSPSSSCHLLALAYSRENRVLEALRTWARACELADDPRDWSNCSQLVGQISAHATELGPELTHYRGLAKNVCFGKSPSTCQTAAELFETIEPKAPEIARELYVRDCERTGDHRSCAKAEQLGTAFTARQRAEQDATRAREREYQKAADAYAREQERIEREKERWSRTKVDEIPMGDGYTPSSNPPSPATPSTSSQQPKPTAPSSTTPAATAKPPASVSSSKPAASASAPPVAPPATAPPPAAPPPPAPPKPVTFQTSGTSDYWFADDTSCCQKLFALKSLAEAAVVRACQSAGGRAKLETARWSAAAYCSPELCGGTCGHTYRCRALAEGTCER